MKEIRDKLRNPFYRGYLWFTSLETELLFFVVCDVTFLTQVKKLSPVEISRVTFLSLVFSIVILAPMLKFINRFGNRVSVRLGSVAFLFSAVLMTIAPNFAFILAGGFMKCIAHTLNAMGTAVLKNHLTQNHSEDQFVFWQSDANSAASLVMMITSLLCGGLFRVNAYLPMIACIALCMAGVVAAFRISSGESQKDEIQVPVRKKGENRPEWVSPGMALLISFALFTALTGSGLSYSKMNIQELLSGMGSESVITLLSVVSALVYLFRFLSNVMMKTAYVKLGNKALLVASVALTAGLCLQIIPRFASFAGIAMVLSVGYLLQAFVRDPYITLVQNISLTRADLRQQQSMLIALNGAKKFGLLALSATCTLILRNGSVLHVIVLMTLASCVNVVLCLMGIVRHGTERKESRESDNS